MKRYIVIIFLLLPFAVHAQIITLFAGGGTSSPDAGGAATSVFISDPVGGTFDKNGNYFFASCLSGNRIFKIDVAGNIHVVAGNGTSGFNGDSSMATVAELSVPSAIKFDTGGNLFICDAGNNCIREVNAASGIIRTIAGSGSTVGYGGDSGLAIMAMLHDPQDICFDKSNNLYIADATNQRIRKVDPSGIITTIAGTGTPGFSGDNGPATVAEIRNPTGLAVDDTGNLYIAGGNVVRKINSTGIITTVAGVNGMYAYTHDGILATDAPMFPIKIGIDPYGQLVIADYSNYRVFRVTLEGIIYTIAGNGIDGYSGEGGVATAAELDYPSGVAYDTCANLYFPTTDGHISKVTFNPSCLPLKTPQVVKSEVNIYPNPTTETINVDNVTNQTKYAIINITGIIEQSGTLKSGNNSIPVQALPIGIHLLQLTDNEGAVTVHKIVKQ